MRKQLLVSVKSTRSALLCAVLVCTASVRAQLQHAPVDTFPGTSFAAASLPDAPGALRTESSSAPATGGPVASVGRFADQAAVTAPPGPQRFAITIQPGEVAQTLSAGDKFQIGIRKQLTLGAFGSALVSAGYAHLADTRPHYGVDKAGFGERLGGAALKQTSQSIFYYGVYSNLFHEDPRYYVLGPAHPFKRRVLYAASSVVMTRKDSGGNTVNWALLSATASASALANAYYPERDREVSRTVTSVLTSLALRAATQQLREFGGDIRQRLHRKHQ